VLKSEQLVNGIKRICKDYGLPHSNEDLYSHTEEEVIKIGKALRAKSSEIDEQRAAEKAQEGAPAT
jgi:hypothetical protein